jgi:hypothetical protein
MVEPSKSAIKPRERQQLVMYNARRQRVNVLPNPGYPSNLSKRVAQWLFPQRALPYRLAISLFLGVPWGTVVHWLAGRRLLPRWAQERMLAAIRVRLSIGQAILAELEAYQPPLTQKERGKPVPPRKSPPNDNKPQDSTDSPNG